ncbi:hypothetical protein Bca4012_065629 [Brassica carinata]
MSKRPASSVPLFANGAKSRRRVDSLASRSDISSDPNAETDYDLLAPLPLTYARTAPLSVGPTSLVIEDDLIEWRRKYSLPSHVILRAPTSEKRASIHAPGEIAVYEAFFKTGFRGGIPALIVGLCDLFEISPSQLNPPAWRILIAIQNLGDLAYLSFGINEASGTHPAPSEGESTVLQARQLPLDRRQVDFLIGENCAGNMSGSAADDSFAAYQETAKVMSAKRGSASRAVSGDDVVVTGSRCATVVKTEPPLHPKGEEPGSAETGRSAGSLATALSNLNLSVFPRDENVLPNGDTSEVIQVLQGGLLQDRHTARELEIRDLKEKVKALEKTAGDSSADALAANQEIRR